ncbi:MAG: endopeptidase La [Coxiellaceae bacterium]|nr:endopeptidase La [Coxiellaceae bacterium]
MTTKKNVTTIPAMPLRDVVIYPFMVIPLFVGRTESINALDNAMGQDKQVLLITQRDAKTDKPEKKDVYEIGTVATILQLLRLPDGTIKVLVEGSNRARIKNFAVKDGAYEAEVEMLEKAEVEENRELDIYKRSVMSKFEELVKINNKIPTEVVVSLGGIDDPGRLADSIAAHMTTKIESRQKLLETLDAKERLDALHSLLIEELDLMDVEKRIQGRVKTQVEKNQRQYYLSEKIKAIQSELGEIDEGAGFDELADLEKKIETAGLSEEAKEKADAEMKKLKLMSPMSAEATVCRNYLDWLVKVPWKKKSKVNKNLKKAETVLEEDHYGLEKVKERILEYLAVQHRVKKLKGPILCLVGPPGVGKTSLGQSIANATGREFARISLGGVRDEAEIRGHRRTYIGALPGKVLQKLAKVKVRNPLFMLDEVDKMAMDFRGDPASALLEVLDPEQNDTFNDHYLEVDYDLSDVMFIATSNSMNIPPALLDRMEVIRLSGYTESEKLNIATKYLLPRQMENSGLKKGEISVSEDAFREIVRSYTREAGVRNLEREIAKICRKVVKELLLDEDEKAKKRKVTAKNIEDYLGVKKFRFGLAEDHDQVGQVTGLAWTEVGGDILTIEAQVIPGRGKSSYTGSLGDVMTESIQAAMTVVRSRSVVWGLSADFYQQHDFHVHVPEGATPKDGPSAGGAMCTALVSAITQIPVRADVAMTGEITLRGEVLPIGGLKEKLLAALRGGIKHVIIPDENKRDLKEIPEEVLKGLEVHPVKWIDQVFELALQRLPEQKGIDKINRTLKGAGKSKGGKSDGQDEAHCH